DLLRRRRGIIGGGDRIQLCAEPIVRRGRLESDDEPALEPRAPPILESAQLVRRTVGGEHQLDTRAPRTVEEVEQLLLRALRLHQRIDTVDDEQTRATIACAPAVHLIALERADQLRGKVLAGQERDACIAIAL